MIIDENTVFGGNKDLSIEFLYLKMRVWLLTHKITVKGYSIEPGFQDVTEVHEGQGVYSIRKDGWVHHPAHKDYDFTNDKLLKKKVQFYSHMIEKALTNNVTFEEASALKDKIQKMRASAIEQGGEFSFENLVFKSLRNKGYIDRLNKYMMNYLDKDLSLE